MDVIKLQGTILAVLALCGAAGFAARKVWRWIRSGAHFVDHTLPRLQRALDDVIGTDENPGVVDRLKAQDADLARVLHELFPNGGGSLRDDVVRIAHGVEQARERAAEAVDEAAALQAALGRADHKGSLERAEMAARLEVLMTALAGFAAETRSREDTYIRALRDQGVADLTGLVDAADDPPT